MMTSKQKMMNFKTEGVKAALLRVLPNSGRRALEK
jgi:hypothetical protein